MARLTPLPMASGPVCQLDQSCIRTVRFHQVPVRLRTPLQKSNVLLQKESFVCYLVEANVRSLADPSQSDIDAAARKPKTKPTGKRRQDPKGLFKTVQRPQTSNLPKLNLGSDETAGPLTGNLVIFCVIQYDWGPTAKVIHQPGKRNQCERLNAHWLLVPL